jgi:hypothetical protein
MNDFFILIKDVGAPIAGSLAMGFFIFLVIKQMLEGIIERIKTLTMSGRGLIWPNWTRVELPIHWDVTPMII